VSDHAALSEVQPETPLCPSARKPAGLKLCRPQSSLLVRAAGLYRSLSSAEVSPSKALLKDD